ncbi:hypothetical protein [Streptomyces hoynatensis]|uniref:Uncharacterized protein n=1 Tax=Streptomyces hoynatensis TaxID=1141874 RepID=A0A3A9Z4N1_9ACTN|nr:hypothetical protein [Streptomyces hoynatensis]RKN43019.1 hypothetical protein D7294_10920 [Streptomyces hoynatensis]
MSAHTRGAGRERPGTGQAPGTGTRSGAESEPGPGGRSAPPGEAATGPGGAAAETGGDAAETGGGVTETGGVAKTGRGAAGETGRGAAWTSRAAGAAEAVPGEAAGPAAGAEVPRPAAGAAGEGSLLPAAEAARLRASLRRAVVGFVDGPAQAVVEADAVLESAVTHLTEALRERRLALRTAWQAESAEFGDGALGALGTEEARQLLLDYRDTTERLLGA